VLYLLDGRSHFRHVAGVVDYLIGKHRIPPLIIVGVDSADRSRDFTPTNGSTYLGKPLPDMETSGHAAN
jgi:hypothetical protein